MTKYEINQIPSILIGFALLLIVGAHLAFADETKRIEFSPYMDFNGSVHGGVNDRFDGIAFSGGAGAELLYVVNDGFAFGANAKTSLHYENYMEDAKTIDRKYKGDALVDEYGVWTATAGGIVYMGDMFYLSYMAIYHVDTFHESTYISDDEEGDIEQEKAPYKIDRLNYALEAGFRVSYHFALYADVTTHLVETGVDRSKYQVYLGLKYHI